MSSQRIRLACVPEQVNIPISLGCQSEIFEKYGIDLQVVSVPEGTGKMIDMLEKEEVDVAITVADALIVARNKSKHIQLIGTWVESPLTWAVASSPKNVDLTVKDLVEANGKLRVGISRLGSGSHTMANYLAMLHNIDASLLEFHIANNITGLREGIAKHTFDIFLWETFTTKIYFDSGELVKLEDVSTPWPAFVFATKSSTDATSITSTMQQLHNLIHTSLFPALEHAAEEFVEHPYQAIALIEKEFGHKSEDAALWLSRVRYNHSIDMALDKTVFEKSLEVLKSIDLVTSSFQLQDLWDCQSSSLVTIL